MNLGRTTSRQVIKSFKLALRKESLTTEVGKLNMHWCVARKNNYTPLSFERNNIVTQSISILIFFFRFLPHSGGLCRQVSSNTRFIDSLIIPSSR